ncbi:hypothetical protein [Streptomyces sp. NPDC092307]|uniref:hypothetical protein n=1 Tax=Streptomyces sp. NPDC092307 TaxID=3366013 RepID=UPI00380D3A47
MSRPVRPDRELMPPQGVGPLWFGMRLAEVAAALPDLTALRRFQADPASRRTLGVEFAAGRAEPAVRTYFVDDRLSCVAADAAHGPQVTLWGRQLTGRVPDDLERFLGHAHACEVVDVSYGPRGNPGVDGLGLVLRLQAVADRVVTRPVLVGRAWADPVHRRLGRRDPGMRMGGLHVARCGCAPRSRPPPDHATHWGSWRPPF